MLEVSINPLALARVNNVIETRQLLYGQVMGPVAFSSKFLGGILGHGEVLEGAQVDGFRNACEASSGEEADFH